MSISVFYSESWGAGEPAGARAGGGGEKGVPVTTSGLPAVEVVWPIWSHGGSERLPIVKMRSAAMSSVKWLVLLGAFPGMQARAGGSADGRDGGIIPAAGGRG